MIKLVRKLSGVLAFIMLFCGVRAAVYAQELIDPDRSDCSLNVVMKYDGKPVVGGSVTLYKVGSIIEDEGGSGFKLFPRLESDVDTKRLESRETAEKVCESVQRQKLPGTSVDVGTDGTAVFGGLTAGLYLARQEKTAPGFYSMGPFLISIPQWDGKSYVYNITAAAKTEIFEGSLPYDKPKPSPETELPLTGQLNWPVVLFLVFGSVFLIMGFVMKKKNEA